MRWNRADCRDQPKRDRQIVMRAFFGQVSGGEIDGDAAGRQREGGGDQGRAHPLPCLGYGPVWQADDVECRQPRRDLHLNIEGASLDALERDGGDPLDHWPILNPAGTVAGRPMAWWWV